MGRGSASWKSSCPDVPPGTMLGEYVVRRRIDAGGMGTVYAGGHPVIGKKVAIKLIHPHVAQNPENIQRFKQEAMVVNAIGDPGIVDIFGFGEYDDGRYYFVMEYLRGERLLEFLKRHGKLGAFAAGQLLRMLALSLAAAHAKGVIHRDLKAENIFLVPSNDGHWPPRTKLLDFGLAKLLESIDGQDLPKTRQGITLGTPYYMSPEQCRGKPVDARSDIYALGVLGYEMITGRLPFVHEDLTEVMHMHLREKVQLPPAADRPALVDELILGCLEKNPEDRPHDMHEVISALEMIFPPLAPLRIDETGSDFESGSPQISEHDDDSEPIQTPVAPPPAQGASAAAASPPASLPHVPSETLRVAPAPAPRPSSHVVEVEGAGRGLGLFLTGFFLGMMMGMGVLYLIMR
ncbi:MAG: hypothetical protein CVU65_05815 [Deltaproteobacteria bacterium HGW-Deltaproteobacteria-22]|nr:MAG: hypothetical protein CVU65_05815 [Deltaproteobacteria bacterium HGW-Deltaproteobacteria-22]